MISSRLPVLHTWPSLDKDINHENEQEIKGRRSIGGHKGEVTSNKMVVNLSPNNHERRLPSMSPQRISETNYMNTNGIYSSPNQSNDYYINPNSHSTPVHRSESGNLSSRYSTGSMSSNSSIYGSKKDFITSSPIKLPNKHEKSISMSSPRRSHSPDVRLHLDSSLGLDRHHDVHAEPLYSYVQDAPNHRTYQERAIDVGHPPSTPGRTPRGSALSMSPPVKKDERWC